jgi:hypothetical protein
MIAHRIHSTIDEVESALDDAGVPVGNEHESYSTAQRVKILAEIKDSCWREIDRLRSKIAQGKADQ